MCVGVPCTITQHTSNQSIFISLFFCHRLPLLIHFSFSPFLCLSFNTIQWFRYSHFSFILLSCFIIFMPYTKMLSLPNHNPYIINPTYLSFNSHHLLIQPIVLKQMWLQSYNVFPPLLTKIHFTPTISPYRNHKCLFSYMFAP